MSCTIHAAVSNASPAARRCRRDASKANKINAAKARANAMTFMDGYYPETIKENR